MINPFLKLTGGISAFSEKVKLPRPAVKPILLKILGPLVQRLKSLTLRNSHNIRFLSLKYVNYNITPRTPERVN